MRMKYAMIAVDESASMDIKEQLVLTGTKKIEMTDALLENGMQEVVILSTCHRNEIYLYVDDADDEYRLIQLVASLFGDESFATHLLFLEGQEVINHLFQVAAGLKSVVIGEDQILGQVKQALSEANAMGSSGKMLKTLFREVITTAKKIKAETHISEVPLSLSYIGIQLLLKELSDIPHPSVLIVGIGKMGQLALKYLQEEDFSKIYVTNRHFEKITSINQYDQRFIPVEYEDRYQILPQVDAVITATSSPHLIIRADQLPERDKPLVMVDLAMPRDIDEKVRSNQQVKLFNMDDFMRLREENNQKRLHFAKQAMGYIEEAIQKFNEWQKEANVVPAIALLNEKVNTIHRDTMDFLNHKLDLSQHDQKIIDKMILSALKRMVRQPILNLKAMESDQQEVAVSALESLYAEDWREE